MKVKVEAYGMGTRWHCPQCDVRWDGRFWLISWTNSPPPERDECPRCTTFTTMHDDLVVKYGLRNRLVSVLSTRIIRGVDTAEHVASFVSDHDWQEITRVLAGEGWK